MARAIVDFIPALTRNCRIATSNQRGDLVQNEPNPQASAASDRTIAAQSC